MRLPKFAYSAAMGTLFVALLLLRPSLPSSA